MIDYSTYDDAALLRVISGLDSSGAGAFTEFYHRHSANLYSSIFSLVKDPTVAEETVQEIFSRLWQRRHTLEVDENPGGYLNRMGRNLVIDFFRQAKRDRLALERLKDAGETNLNPEQPTALDKEQLLKEQEAMLLRAISTLTPQRRRIFEMCKLEGKSYAQVAGELGISTNTVEASMVRAKKDIKDHLSGQGELAMALIIMLGLLGE